MRKLGIVLVVLAAIALVYVPAMAADQTTAPAATAPVKKADKPADVKAGKTTTPAAPVAATDPAKTGKKSKIKKEPVTVTGMVVEVKDKKGKVTAVAIQTDKDTIQVVKKDKEADVIKLVGKKVEVKGFPSEKKLKNGTVKKYIRVIECKATM